MPTQYPSINDRDFDLLKKIVTNTALLADTEAGDVSSVNGRTGAVTLTKSDVGLNNVDNTSDANKPVSTATQTALNLKANAGANTDITSLGASAGVPIKGTVTNDNAAAGYVGEAVTSTVASAAAVALTSTIWANVTSISLTAGDWDVSGMVGFKPDPTTGLYFLIGGIGLDSASSLPELDRAIVMPGGIVSPYVSLQMVVPQKRLSLAATTTVYLVVDGAFDTSTLGAFGTLTARRVR